MNKSKKARDPFNPENNDWRAQLRPSKTAQLLADMKYAGVPNRPTAVQIGLELFHKHYGAPENK